MQLERLSVDTLFHDPRNARAHDEDNLVAIAKSLERFGQQKPIVVSTDNVVIAGNGTLAAAKRLGWTHIEAVRSVLQGDDATAFGIADNRTAELARWDYQVLAESLKKLEATGYDLATTGWSFEEFQNLAGAQWTPPEVMAELDSFIPNDAKANGGQHTVSFTPEQWKRLTAAIELEDPAKLAEAITRLAESQ